MRFVFKMIVFPFWLLTAFLALMLKWTLNLSAFVLALPMLYIFGCGLYTLYCREWLQFLILLVAEFGCFVLIFMGALIVFSGVAFVPVSNAVFKLGLPVVALLGYIAILAGGAFEILIGELLYKKPLSEFAFRGFFRDAK